MAAPRRPQLSALPPTVVEEAGGWLARHREAAAVPRRGQRAHHRRQRAASCQACVRRDLRLRAPRGLLAHARAASPRASSCSLRCSEGDALNYPVACAACCICAPHGTTQRQRRSRWST